MARLIDADALKQTFCAECNHSIKCEDCDIDYHFEHLAPAIDAVEVVRCKNCAYWDATEKVCVDRMTADENGYCAWGERREDETD